jgi:hypothetical protein
MLLFLRLNSATGGADSRPASGPTTPTDEQKGIGQGNLNVILKCPLMLYSIFYLFFAAVTHKVTAGAKSFGSFLYSSINKAGAKISETVKHNVSRHAYKYPQFNANLFSPFLR